MTGNARPIMIMAGGTGGHVYPALAVAEHLQASGMPVVWLGTRRGIEARLVPAAGIPIEWISISGLRGKGRLALLKAPFKLLFACWQALQVMRKWRPAAVLGMGGFVAGPGGLTAWLTGKPLIIHEQNAVSGLTNRLLAKVATRVMEAFPGSFNAQAGATAVGNPVSANIANLPAPEQRLQGREGPLHLLVVGGSLGAQALNEVMPALLTSMPEDERPQVWHQAGMNNIEQAAELYRQAGLEVQLTPYIEDMAEAYAWADLVICRAGAMTVSEVAAAGVAAVFVPYPHAVDDHQTRNAHYLSGAGAAVLMPQPMLSGRHLAQLLRGMTRERILEMSIKARQLAQTEAAGRVAEECLRLGGNHDR